MPRRTACNTQWSSLATPPCLLPPQYPRSPTWPTRRSPRSMPPAGGAHAPRCACCAPASPSRVRRCRWRAPLPGCFRCCSACWPLPCVQQRPFQCGCTAAHQHIHFLPAEMAVSPLPGNPTAVWTIKKAVRQGGRRLSMLEGLMPPWSSRVPKLVLALFSMYCLPRLPSTPCPAHAGQRRV